MDVIGGNILQKYKSNKKIYFELKMNELVDYSDEILLGGTIHHH